GTTRLSNRIIPRLITINGRLGGVKMRIRNFRMQDYAKVVRLWKEADLVLRPGDERVHIQTKLRRDPEFFLVAEEDGSLVATVLGTWDGRRGWIHHLAVRPSRQRSGLGTMLVCE